MGWNSFSPTEKKLTSNIMDTRFKYELLGDKKIVAHCVKTVSFQGVEKTIDCSAQKEIIMEAPNLVTNDGKFLRTNEKLSEVQDNEEQEIELPKKFLDIRGENINGE